MSGNSRTPRGRGRQARSALKRACALLRGTAAFTLTEALATVIIVGLATSMLASGVALASKHLASSMALSESSMLYATLEQVLINELSYTNTIFGADNGDGTYKVTGFVSKHYIAVDAPDEGGEGAGGSGEGAAAGSGGAAGSGASGSTIPTYYLKMVDDSGAAHPVDPSVNSYGQLAMCDESGSAVNRLLGDSSYNYNVVACVKSLTFDPKKKLFIVSLSIAQSTDLDNPLVDEVFTTRALNTVYLGDTALTTPGNSSTNNPHPAKPPTTPSGSFVVIGDGVTYMPHVTPMENAAGLTQGNVFGDSNNKLYFVVNKETLPENYDPSKDSTTGNSAAAIRILMAGDEPRVVSYKDIEKNKRLAIGTLCIGEDNRLYIRAHDTGENLKPPKGSGGGWLLVNSGDPILPS